MTKNWQTFRNLLNFMKISTALFHGTEQNLVDLTNLFPFTDIMFTNDINEINQISFFEQNDLKIIFIEEPEVVRNIHNFDNKIFLSTKYNSKFTKITREILINIYENHFQLNIPCDIKQQIEDTKTHESVYSTIYKIHLNNGLYNPQHTPVIFNREHPITFLLNKMHTIPVNSQKNQILKTLAKILHTDFLVTGNITLTSFYKLIEKMIN